MAVAVHVRARMHSGGAGGVPRTSATGRRADWCSVRVFGCPAYVHVNKSKRRKLDDRAWKGVFVGHACESPAWFVYNHATRRVVRSRTVVFDDVVVLSMGGAVRSNAMMMKRTTSRANFVEVVHLGFLCFAFAGGHFPIGRVIFRSS
jgi:hypothetical protein